MNIGFIGLGNMGAPMAANLAAAGHQVTGFDTVAPCPDGVAQADSATHAAEGAEIVITMLPNGAILRAVADEVLPAMAPGAVLLDCSTVDVASARDVATKAENAGIYALDAPVSGGTGGATAGTLTFMVGGPDAAFATAKPLFDIMGQKAVHCGPAGNGQAAKICNNMILGVTMIATCEAFALADKLGLDRQAMFDVVSTSSGQSWSMNTYCPAPGIGPTSPADNDYKPGFRRRPDAEGPAVEPGSRRGGRCRHPDGCCGAGPICAVCRDRGWRGARFSRPCCPGSKGAAAKSNRAMKFRGTKRAHCEFVEHVIYQTPSRSGRRSGNSPLPPFFTPEFGGFDPNLYPVPQEYPPAQPAGYAFAIWGLIYVWLIAHGAFGLFARAKDPVWDAGRPPVDRKFGYRGFSGYRSQWSARYGRQ